jgi:hypothetical protein
LSLITLIGCANLRGGFANVPYVGEDDSKIPSTSTYWGLWDLYKIELSGINLDINLYNAIRTYDYTFYFFIIPVHIDREIQLAYVENAKTNKLNISVDITPLQPGFSFDPRYVVINIEGQKYDAIATFIEDEQTRLRIMEVFRANLPKGSPTPGTPTATPPSPDQWRNPVDKRVPLTKVGKKYSFIISFNVSVPLPERSIQLDLSKAIDNPDLPKVPIIKFKKIPWSEGRGY